MRLNSRANARAGDVEPPSPSPRQRMRHVRVSVAEVNFKPTRRGVPAITKKYECGVQYLFRTGWCGCGSLPSHEPWGSTETNVSNQPAARNDLLCESFAERQFCGHKVMLWRRSKLTIESYFCICLVWYRKTFREMTWMTASRDMIFEAFGVF